MPFDQITTKSLALSSITSDTILNNTIKFDDLSNEVSSAILNAGAGIISKTYAELKALKDSSQLVSGQWYKITDFQLAWWDYTINNPQEIRSSVVEPLIVSAITENKFATIAYSTLYPADIIYYNFDNTYGWGRLGVGSFVPMPNTRGWITRRIGQQYVGASELGSVDAPYDWRNITWSCRRVNISSIPEWSPNETYSLRQIVKHFDKLFISLGDNNTGRINDNGFTRDNPPSYLRLAFNSGRDYTIGDEVAYTLPSNGSVKYYRKTAQGAIGTLPTVTATWTEASLLSDFDFANRKLGYAFYLGESEGYYSNPFYWTPVSPFVEGKTYFPTNETGNQTAFSLVLPSKMEIRKANDETPWSLLGAGNGSGKAKYTSGYGQPRLFWNWDVYYPNLTDYINLPWDLTTKAQKPTFASPDPTTTNSTFYAEAGRNVKLAGYGNVFYSGNGSGGQGDGSSSIELGENSNFNVFKGRTYNLVAKNNFSNNKIGYYIEDNVFGNNCTNNSFSSLCNGNVFGDSFQFNIMGINSRNNTFGSYCKNNTLGSGVQNNVIDSQFLSNFCVGWFYENTIGSTVGGNVFRFFSAKNEFSGYCFNNDMVITSCIIGKEFNNNISQDLNNCKIYVANNNNFGIYFQQNECSDINNCVFVGYAAGNKFSNVQYMNASANLYNNNITEGVRIVVGYNFRMNTIESSTYVNYNANASFGSATHVYNPAYHKRIFLNSAGVPRLSYYNSSDVQVVTSPTA
jgi:hypothetical protein